MIISPERNYFVSVERKKTFKYNQIVDLNCWTFRRLRNHYTIVEGNKIGK